MTLEKQPQNLCILKHVASHRLAILEWLWWGFRCWRLTCEVYGKADELRTWLAANVTLWWQKPQSAFTVHTSLLKYAWGQNQNNNAR